MNEIALPFLLEVAASPQVPDRVPLYRLLQAMLGSESIPMSPRHVRSTKPTCGGRTPGCSDGDATNPRTATIGNPGLKGRRRPLGSAGSCCSTSSDPIRRPACDPRPCAARRDGRSSWGQPWVKPKEAAKLVAFFRPKPARIPTWRCGRRPRWRWACCRRTDGRSRRGCGVCKSESRSRSDGRRSRLEPHGLGGSGRGFADAAGRRTGRIAAARRRGGYPLAVGGSLRRARAAAGRKFPAAVAAPALAVPFPQLSLWLDASVRKPAGLAKAATELFAAAETPRKMRLIALLGRLHLKVPALDEFLRSVTSNRRESPAIRVRAAAALQERKAGLPAKRFETLVRAGLRSADPDVRRSVVDAVADIPTFLTPDGFENVNDDDNPVEAAWDAFGMRLLPLVVGEVGKESDPQVRLAFACYVRGIHFRWVMRNPAFSRPPPCWQIGRRTAHRDRRHEGHGLRSALRRRRREHPELAPILRTAAAIFPRRAEHRASAARLLLKIQSRQADTIPLLLPLLESDSDDGLRGRIAYAPVLPIVPRPQGVPARTDRRGHAASCAPKGRPRSCVGPAVGSTPAL